MLEQVGFSLKQLYHTHVDYYCASTIQHYIFQLEVTMHESLGMEVGHR